MNAPSGSAITAAIATALRLTRSERATISISPESSVKIIDSAAPMADEKSFILETRSPLLSILSRCFSYLLQFGCQPSPNPGKVPTTSSG